MPERRRPQPADRARFTSRAAVLAVVICAVALSLAYPVREYIAQRRQIDQLHGAAADDAGAAAVRCNGSSSGSTIPAYVEQLARDRLHFCMPGQTCYVIIGGPGSGSAAAQAAGTRPGTTGCGARYSRRTRRPGRGRQRESRR